jgi:rod shape-determining protein MreD
MCTSLLLGQHALAYTVLMYRARVFHRRVLLRPLQQPWQMVGLFAAAHAAYVLAGLLAGRGMPGWVSAGAFVGGPLVAVVS